MRRDLQMLVDQKLLSRTYGGAVAQQVTYELVVPLPINIGWSKPSEDR